MVGALPNDGARDDNDGEDGEGEYRRWDRPAAASMLSRPLSSSSSSSSSSSCSCSPTRRNASTNNPFPAVKKYTNPLARLSEKTTLLTVEAARYRRDMEERRGINNDVNKERDRTGGGNNNNQNSTDASIGIIKAILVLVVRLILVGARGVVVVEWALGKAVEALVWMVELSVLLVAQVQQV
ncbi:hypothetical protein VTJ04DRAFT_3896 [Mycothermus thermophilus]|uniref:uncharacterized protein n=1 Tax=Humicola insolens TaxID=85995 RepID=UPI003741FC8A